MHATGDREDNVEWSADTQEIWPGASILFSTESEETDWRNSLNSLKATPATKAEHSLSMVGKMKKGRRVTADIIPCVVVTSLETDAFVAIVAYCRQADGKSNLSARSKRRYSRNSCHSEKKKKKVRGCVSQDSDTPNRILRKVEELGLNASATSEILRMHLVQIEFGKEKGNLEALSKKVNLMSEILARPGRRNTWGNLMTSRLFQQCRVEFGEKICKLKPNMKLRFILLWRRQRHSIAYVIVNSGASMHNAEQGELSSDTIDTLRRSKTPWATYRDREQCK